jgi:hypothetical protein
MVKVSMTDLVHGMISLLYNTLASETLHRKFEWSLSSGNLPDFVFNIVRLQDCFRHTNDGSFVFFNLSHSYTVGDLTAFADLHWRLPRVTFSALSTRLVNGQMYRIIPHFADAGSGTTVCSGFSARKDDIMYSVIRSPLPLQWDFTHDCFHAPVLHDSPVCCHYALGSLFTFQFADVVTQADGEVLETVLSVKITTPFHAGTRFERVSRYNIKLEVDTEPYQNAVEIPGTHARRDWIPKDSEDYSAPWLDPRLQGLFRSPCNAAPSSLYSHSSPWIPSYTSTPLSKIRRSTPLVSQPAHKDYCILTKDSVESQTWFTDQPAHKTLHGFTNKKSPINMECSSAYGEKIVSPGKRKGSSSGLSIDAAVPSTLNKEDRPKLEVDTKRRKLRQNVDSDVVMSSGSDLFAWDEPEDNVKVTHLAVVPTELMGAQTSTRSNHSLWSQQLEDNEHNYSSGTSASAGETLPGKLAGIKQPSLTWQLPKMYDNHSPASSADSSPVHDITPPITASTITSASTDALQEKIQQNYHEFEERKKQNAAEKEYYKATVPGFDGIVSPTDVGDTTFEGIFMGDDDADGWSSDDDGISQRTGSICLEE